MDAALRRERRKRLTDAGRPQAARVPELGQRQRPIRLRQNVLDLMELHRPQGSRVPGPVPSPICRFVYPEPREKKPISASTSTTIKMIQRMLMRDRFPPPIRPNANRTFRTSS